MAILDILDFDSEMQIYSGNNPSRRWDTRTSTGQPNGNDGNMSEPLVQLRIDNLEYLIAAFLSIMRANPDILFAPSPALGHRFSRLKLDFLLSPEKYPENRAEDRIHICELRRYFFNSLADMIVNRIQLMNDQVAIS